MKGVVRMVKAESCVPQASGSEAKPINESVSAWNLPKTCHQLLRVHRLIARVYSSQLLYVEPVTYRLGVALTWYAHADMVVVGHTEG